MQLAGRVGGSPGPSDTTLSKSGCWCDVSRPTWMDQLGLVHSKSRWCDLGTYRAAYRPACTPSFTNASGGLDRVSLASLFIFRRGAAHVNWGFSGKPAEHDQEVMCHISLQVCHHTFFFFFCLILEFNLPPPSLEPSRIWRLISHADLPPHHDTSCIEGDLRNSAGGYLVQKKTRKKKRKSMW